MTHGEEPVVQLRASTNPERRVLHQGQDVDGYQASRGGGQQAASTGTSSLRQAICTQDIHENVHERFPRVGQRRRQRSVDSCGGIMTRDEVDYAFGKRWKTRE